MNPFLMCDYYKTCHAQMLPEGITKSVSYFIPRGNRIPGWDKAVFFGLRGFIEEYLVDTFKNEFFRRKWHSLGTELTLALGATLGKPDCDRFIERVHSLWNLARLPIEIAALPEGSHVPMGVPMFSITNTHPDFAWLPQFLESLISCEMWHSIVVATVADKFKALVNAEYRKTSDADPDYALSLFSMRGEESIQSATKSGAAWATSFIPCATVSTAEYLHRYYGVNYGETIRGSPSTEHAVMCSNAAVDGDEVTFIRRILTDIYPNTSFSIVLDSYDYWHMVKEVLPALKKDILAHNGCMLIRGDSGNPVDVVTETVFELWKIFGGTVNSKGYKVLDRHVKAIYGDQITLERAAVIYRTLRREGFAADNVALGVGSYSTQAVKVDGEHYPFTRDTFNMAIKCTYVEVDGKPYNVYKAPKGADIKRSPKGCVWVYEDDGRYIAKDGHNWNDTEALYYSMDRCPLRPVFVNGKTLYGEEDTLKGIRRRLNNYQE